MLNPPWQGRQFSHCFTCRHMVLRGGNRPAGMRTQTAWLRMLLIQTLVVTHACILRAGAHTQAAKPSVPPDTKKPAHQRMRTRAKIPRCSQRQASQALPCCGIRQLGAHNSQHSSAAWLQQAAAALLQMSTHPTNNSNNVLAARRETSAAVKAVRP